MNITSWSVPAGTPQAVVDKIASDTGQVISAPAFVDKYVVSVGHELVNAHGNKFWQMLAGDRQQFAARIKPLNLKRD